MSGMAPAADSRFTDCMQTAGASLQVAVGQWVYRKCARTGFLARPGVNSESTTLNVLSRRYGHQGEGFRSLV